MKAGKVSVLILDFGFVNAYCSGKIATLGPKFFSPKFKEKAFLLCNVCLPDSNGVLIEYTEM